MSATGPASSRPAWLTGPLAWMAANPVAANLLMLVLLIGGWIIGSGVKQEVFPEFDADIVTIDIAYPGASPEEVEQGVILAVEDAVRSIDGVKTVESSSYEGAGVVIAEIVTGSNANKITSDIKNAVDRITSFPEDAERPITSLIAIKAKVISLILHGETDLATLRELAERARTDLLNRNDITEVVLTNAPPREISIEVPSSALHAYGLSLPEIADRIQAYAVELPGGAIRTEGGEVLVRLDERRKFADEFLDIPLRTSRDGSVLTLGDIAELRDGFSDNSYLKTTFNGRPAVTLEVFRVGEQTPISVSAAVREYADTLNQRLPEGLAADTVYDDSEFYEDRINLLLRNGFLGFVLVIVLLTLFLEPRLAFWVTLGIPISFLGAMLLMPAMDVSFNMISLFGFIVTLGIVVDDAIIVGENIYHQRELGHGRLKAAVLGARSVATPVTFAILTTIVAFSPLLFVPGPAGNFFRVLPAIVICVLLMSLVESLLILPSHLAHSRHPKNTGVEGYLVRIQHRVAAWMERVIEQRYTPVVRWATSHRTIVIALGIAVFVSSIGLVAGGRVKAEFFPNIEADFIFANIQVPYGSNIDRTREVLDEAVSALYATLDEYPDDADIIESVITELGSQPSLSPAYRESNGLGSSHLMSVQVSLSPWETRTVTAQAFSDRWREKVQQIPGVERTNFIYTTGPGAGSDLTIQLKHHDVATLEQAADALVERLQRFSGLSDIDNGYSGGKEQLDITLTPAGKTLGLTAAEVGRQVRGAFFGAEALRQQRGRDEVRVMVRLPEAERAEEATLEELLIRTPAGGLAPLREIAQIERGQAYTTIRRDQGRRVLNVTADVDTNTTQTNDVIAELERDSLPALMDRYIGLEYSFEGANRDEAESSSAIGRGFVLALIGIFVLLAMAFRSYLQPVIVMSAIPFGMVGAIVGHLLLGYKMSFVSLFGIVALSGVVVNDSLVLIDAANRYHREGMSKRDAIIRAGQRRFRPIVLTSLTTFLGLAPMILETSLQARFIIPMAISLGFGILFATVIILLLVPAVFLVIEDLRDWLADRFGGAEHPEQEDELA
ncbi:efflux RND transporter permease subunit [Abyssibacter profundi]|uniref:AcrB/AcrD/AcrF family protein n=1 Tax=Abyssibacter profundi TaxID=2182787 RepID=A0A363UQA2_9GAMM|nr:efflux RND transporter permease subunit [Abyssibacter profundi]PWN57695.1 AcrB/AcrD/AcrF family protein [Abyssibacter profundi]